MKRWMGMMVFAMTLLSWMPKAQAFQLHDLMSVRSESNPMEVWKKMRPQDFVGAPTVWQIIV